MGMCNTREGKLGISKTHIFTPPPRLCLCLVNSNNNVKNVKMKALKYAEISRNGTPALVGVELRNNTSATVSDGGTNPSCCCSGCQLKKEKKMDAARPSPFQTIYLVCATLTEMSTVSMIAVTSTYFS